MPDELTSVSYDFYRSRFESMNKLSDGELEFVRDNPSHAAYEVDDDELATPDPGLSDSDFAPPPSQTRHVAAKKSTCMEKTKQAPIT